MDDIVFETYREEKIKSDDIKQLNKEANELLELQKEFSELLDKQKDKLNLIEKYTEQSKENIQDSQVILEETSEIKKTIDTRYIWSSVILVPIVYLLLL